MAKEIEKIPATLPIAQAGIKSSSDFTNLMSAMITDVLEGTVKAQTCNAVCNAAGKMLKMVEMSFKYAPPSATGENQIDLVLAPAPLGEDE